MHTRFGLNQGNAGVIKRTRPTGMNMRGKRLGTQVVYDQPTHEWLFDAADAQSGGVIRDRAGQNPLVLNVTGSPTMQWVGSGDTLGLDMNTPPISYNASNFWRAANSLGATHTAFTIYVWLTMNTAEDIFDLLSLTKGTGSGNVYRWKLGVGHQKHFEPRTWLTNPDYWSRLSMAGQHTYPSAANLGTEYQGKMPIVYRQGGTKKYTSFIDGQTVLVKFGYQQVGPTTGYSEVGIARLGDAFGFDPEGTGADANFKTQWRKEFGGRTMFTPVGSDINNYAFSSCSLPITEQSDVTYHKIIYYDSVKGFEHDQRVFAQGLSKISWFE